MGAQSALRMCALIHNTAPYLARWEWTWLCSCNGPNDDPPLWGGGGSSIWDFFPCWSKEKVLLISPHLSQNTHTSNMCLTTQNLDSKNCTWLKCLFGVGWLFLVWFFALETKLQQLYVRMFYILMHKFITGKWHPENSSMQLKHGQFKRNNVLF